MKGTKSLQRILVVAAFGLLAAGTALAQIPGEDWTRIAVLGIGTRAIGFSPNYTSDDIVFAGTEGNGVWRSTDGGATWSPCDPGAGLASSTVVDLAVSPSFATDQTLFALTEDGNIFESTNGSSSSVTFALVYSVVNVQSSGTALAIHPSYNSPSGSNLIVFASFERDGLYFTNNGGSSWTKDTGTPAGMLIYDLAISPNYASDGDLFVGGWQDGGPVYRRNGGTYYSAHSGLGSGSTERVTSLLYAGSGLVWAGTLMHGLWRSTTTGSSWSAACDGDASGALPRVNAIARAGSSSPPLIEGRDDRAYRSVLGDGVVCAQWFPQTRIWDVEFQPGWNGTTRCWVFYGTPSGLFRKGCVNPLGRGPQAVDGRCVALAASGRGKFMGSISEGLFKSVPSGASDFPMVRYNNFPGRLVPQVPAVCLSPSYDESATPTGCGTARGTLFIAANFEHYPTYNAIYQSTDFGATWSKVECTGTCTSWPSGVTIYDLALSPAYPADVTMYAGTSSGLYRWNGTSTGWSQVWSAGPVWAVSVPPDYNRSGSSGAPYRTVLISTQDTYPATTLANQVVFSNTDGGSWTHTYWYSTGYGRVTGFAFPYNFVTSSTMYFVSAITTTTAPVGTGGVAFSYFQSGLWFYFSPANTGLTSSPMVWGIAAEPLFLSSTSYQHMLCATDDGIYNTANYGQSWSSVDTRPAFSVQYDPGDATGHGAMAGYQANSATLNPYLYYGAGISGDGGAHWFSTQHFTGYGYLPDDVWATVAHERNTNILFSSSPSMGVFVSEDQGISYRPWNKGMGGTSGPCVLSTGLGISMLANRRNGTNLDIVWVGTASEGIKARYTYYDSTTDQVSLESEDGLGTPNGWYHCQWYDENNTSQGTMTSGRFERIQAVPASAQTYSVWAASPDSGMYLIPAGPYWTWWYRRNLSANPSWAAKGVRNGDDGTDPIPLTSAGTCYDTLSQGAWDYYAIDVPSGTQNLDVFMKNLGGDPDLYVRYNAKPDLSNYDYRPYLGGGSDEEVCVKAMPGEDFDSGITTPSLPSGWTTAQVSGGTGAWYTNAGTHWPSGTASYSSPNLVYFNSYYAVAGNATRFYTASGFSIPSTYGACTLTFWMYHDMGYPSANDTIQPQISLDGGTNWTSVGSAISRYDGTTGWRQVTVSLNGYIGQNSVRLGFLGTSQYGNDCHLDSILVTGTGSPHTLAPGRWYIGIEGYAPGTESYQVTATLNGCATTFVAPGTPKSGGASVRGQSVPDPKAPSGGSTWGTVLNEGVYKGTGTSFESTPGPLAITWSLRNGLTPNNITNLQANTVIQLPDTSLVVGCTGDAYYSPAPDEGLTTWYNSVNGAKRCIGNPGSNDFRDIMRCSANGDVLIAANGTTALNPGGVWLSGDKGHCWMKISSGFDADNQKLESIVADNGNPPSYYSSTDNTGVYTRTITAYPYPAVTSLSPSSGPLDGGTSVTINGANFQGTCPMTHAQDCPFSSPKVYVGGVEVNQANVTYLTDTQISFVTPAHAAGFAAVTVKNPDTRLSSGGPAFSFQCAAPSPASNNTAADLDPYAFSGVLVTWAQEASPWGDGGSGTKSYSVLRNGGIIQSGVAYPATSLIDTTGTVATTYTYGARYVNGCSLTGDTAGASAKDDAEAAGQVSTYMKWNGAGKNRLDWGTTTGADGYKVYRGDASQLPNITNSATVCLAYQGAGASTGAILSSAPSGGSFYWYLVVATKSGAEGTLGTGTGGTAEHVTSSGACGSP